MKTANPTYTLFLSTAVLYFFFNSFLLWQGLYYTTLLTPFFFLYLIRQNGLKYYACFLLLTLCFAGLQIATVAFVRDYIISFCLLQTLAIFVLSFFYSLKQPIDLGNTYKILAYINILLVIIALVALVIPLVKPVFWYLLPISPNIPAIPRLKLFSVEASYYSLVITPVAGYYLLKKIIYRSNHNLLLISLCVSLLLSFSLGVLAAITVSILLVLSFNLNELKERINYNFLLKWFFLSTMLLVGLYFAYKHNPLFVRIKNIFSGEDTSARGRTYEAFHIAWNTAKLKSLMFGCGPGQFKHIGRDFVDYYYSYSNIPTVTRIPNAVAETLCIYGISGLFIRFMLITYLFIRSKIWNNYYRLFLFLFIFIYQFTGSYLFNPAEYVIWILSASPEVFPQFNKNYSSYKLKPA